MAVTAHLKSKQLPLFGFVELSYTPNHLYGTKNNRCHQVYLGWVPTELLEKLVQ